MQFQFPMDASLLWLRGCRAVWAVLLLCVYLPALEARSCPELISIAQFKGALNNVESDLDQRQRAIEGNTERRNPYKPRGDIEHLLETQAQVEAAAKEKGFLSEDVGLSVPSAEQIYEMIKARLHSTSIASTFARLWVNQKVAVEELTAQQQRAQQKTDELKELYFKDMDNDQLGEEWSRWGQVVQMYSELIAATQLPSPRMSQAERDAYYESPNFTDISQDEMAFRLHWEQNQARESLNRAEVLLEQYRNTEDSDQASFIRAELEAELRFARRHSQNAEDYKGLIDQMTERLEERARVRANQGVVTQSQ